ncbi:hypothetical protein K470DRAFT_52991 [Piedraia hortae CBS 480.64]|uniref:Uncharacterized protein n=1 Tax=Piedraia hortae CBS 480.64 TaxID=1314780 RepID=A0A6A7C9C7_9PEZI|nr:hypothetical protein K470DRAFT_52991 [Piedraia hortae CBS 480.64]
MDTALGELYALVENGIKPNFAATAKKHLVNRTTLFKRFQGLTVDRDTALEARRGLSQKQEEELIKYISFMCDWCLPHSPATGRTLTSSFSSIASPIRFWWPFISPTQPTVFSPWMWVCSSLWGTTTARG